MTTLHLHTSHGYPWHNDVGETVFVRGYCFDELEYYYEGVELLEYFSGMSSQEGFVKRLQAANGCFSVVWKHGETVFAAVDRIRSMPLLWARVGKDWHLANEEGQLPGNRVLVEDQGAVFPYTCHTLGHATLWEDIHQLQGGEWIKFSGKNVEIQQYFTYQHQGNTDPKVYKTVAKTSFQRLVQSARGRTLVVPLSGGYDSRFIAAMLKYLGHEEVICFTYGRPSSFEVEISKKVAEQLGYAWHFVEYTEDLLQLYQEKAGLAYQRFAANGTSVAHEQDFFAIHRLLKEEKIPSDSLVVPGFGGDVLAGSWFPTDGPRSWSRLRFIRFLMSNRKFFSGTRKPKLDRNSIQQMIHRELPEGEVSDLSSAYEMLQYWGLRNRMSKFLVNAVRVYDFWELGWRMPFWDHAWMDYWMGIPDAFKPGKSLYLQEASTWLFQPMGIDFHPQSSPPSRLRNLTKQLLPASLVDHLKARWVDRTNADVNNQDTLSLLICQQQGWDSNLLHHFDLNYLMAKAYLETLHS